MSEPPALAGGVLATYHPLTQVVLTFSLAMKFAFISHQLPPTWGGQTVMVYRLLQNVRPEDYCLIAPHNYEATFYEGVYIGKLPATYYQLPPDTQITRGYRFGLSYVREALNAPLGLVSRARRIARIVRDEQCRAVVACTGDFLNLPAGYLASRLAGVPFYAYIFDYYSYHRTDPIEGFYARRFEPILMKGAAGIITPNEFLRDDLRRRYGVEATVIATLATCPPTKQRGGGLRSGGQRRRRAPRTRLRSCTRARSTKRTSTPSATCWQPSGSSGDPTSTCTCTRRRPLTGNASASAAPWSITATARPRKSPAFSGKPTYCSCRSPSAHHTGRDPYLSTSKLGEYLARGVPSWSMRRRTRYLLVLPRPSAGWSLTAKTGGVARAIERLAGDASLRRRLGERAWERARTDFSVAAAQSAFARLLKLS